MNDISSAADSAAAISVSELNRQAKRLLEGGLPKLWVEGEVSNLARPASGHVYFTLKDSSAQLRCAWFRQRQRGPTIQLKNGDNRLAFGKVSIYESRGDYQMIVERVEDAGEGELRRQFEELKKKLHSEGLFDDDRKNDIPTLPGRLGIVTSPSGAAVRDILSVLRRRFPLAPVVIYPTAVQGEAAAGEIVAAITAAVRRKECDVLIISRGGGSLEDMWPFNEETVARAIADCPIPTVSAVGHEVDFTIADFVADLRAPTPSGAAELVVPDQAEWLRIITAAGNRVVALSRRYIDDSSQRLDWITRRLSQSSPAAIVTRQSQWLKNLQQVMVGALRHDLARRSADVERIRSRLLQQSPSLRVQHNVARLQSLLQRLRHTAANSLAGRQNQLRVAARALNSVSPLATLERGYAIVTDSASGRVVTDAGKVIPGTTISAKLSKGSIDATVTGARTSNDQDE